MKEMKNTALIKPNVLLLARGHAMALLGLDAPCDYGCVGLGLPAVTPSLAPARAQGTWEARSVPVGIAAKAAGGPQAKSRTGWDAAAAGEQNWIHVNF